ncbi:MAG: NAD/NADP octopine/nopaline dehydrogenase family protein [Azospirillaceae bacterium]
MTVTLCGGGSLTHAVAAVLGALPDVRVRVLTRRPEAWSPRLGLIYLDRAELEGRLALATGDPRAAVEGADMVVLTVPFFARPATLRAIAPWLEPGAAVGAFPGFGGFHWVARDILGAERTIFGLQRVPYVRRLVAYGRLVYVTGIRPRLYLAASPTSAAPDLAERWAGLLNIPTDPVASWLAVALSQSNAVFHPARLYALGRALERGGGFEARPLFYDDWDDEASRTFLALDADIDAIRAAVPADTSGLATVPGHYGTQGVAGLTARIRTIAALSGRPAPLARTRDGWAFDLETAYFTEDLPYGLLVVKGIADAAGVPTPALDRVLGWGQAVMKRRWLAAGADGVRAGGPDTAGLPLPASFGVRSAETLAASA